MCIGPPEEVYRWRRDVSDVMAHYYMMAHHRIAVLQIRETGTKCFFEEQWTSCAEDLIIELNPALTVLKNSTPPRIKKTIGFFLLPQTSCLPTKPRACWLVPFSANAPRPPAQCQPPPSPRVLCASLRLRAARFRPRRRRRARVCLRGMTRRPTTRARTR